MGTSIRPEVSKKNKYWISRHRYYELKHFCLQFHEWEKELRELRYSVGSDISQMSAGGKVQVSEVCDRTGELASRMADLERNIKVVRRLCREADTEISDYIFRAVVDGETYSKMNAAERIPCCQDVFYDRYHKFFWLLDKVR